MDPDERSPTSGRFPKTVRDLCKSHSIPGQKSLSSRIRVVGSTHSLAVLRKTIGINLRGSSALSQR